ncbi:MAG: PASTA domain-containing protein [Acidobacteriota bacterium]|nr:PASTA domain-containing protein [Acidobacteriota bacterium]
MPISNRLRKAGRLVLLAGALVTTYFVFGAIAMRMALQGRDVTVPNLASQTVEDAQRLLTQRGLSLQVDPSRRPDPRIAAGLIVEQDPEQGTTTRLGRSVRVWISAGARANIIPAFVGQTERGAQGRAAQDGITIARTSIVRSQTYPAGMVIAQVPPPQAHASTVDLLINRGQQDVTYLMPDLIGIDGAQAVGYLQAHGFRVTIVARQPYPGVPAGVVLRQNPQAGFQISPGEAISLEVSR